MVAIVHHPSLEYALVACVAAAGSFLLTPLARRIAIAWGAVARPRDRDVHAVAIPRMGGVALLLGFAMALFVAARLPALSAAFANGPEMTWVLVAGAIICFIGVLDDRYELDSLTKLAGQVLATGVMVTLGGVQLADIYVPWGDSGTVSLGRDLAIPVTILLTVLTINAVNFIDGLDGLAAGVTAIAAGAFFVFSYHLACRRCSPPPSPGHASGSCHTTSPRHGSSWGTRDRCWWGSCSPRRPPRRRPAPIPRRSAVRSGRCHWRCHCSSRSLCWRFRSSTCPSPWFGG